MQILVFKWTIVCTEFSREKSGGGHYNPKNCETQPPASIGWVALSSVVRRRRRCPSVPHCNIYSYLAQIKKNKKTKCILFLNFGSGWPPTPSQLVPKPFNWSPNTVLTDIHCWVEPSLLLSSYTLILPRYLVRHMTQICSKSFFLLSTPHTSVISRHSPKP